MRYLIGLIIINYLPMTAFSAHLVEATKTITERKIIAKQQARDFTQKIKDKSLSGVGRYYIGADGSCDFSTIQQGINATIGDMNAPELLIASNKTYAENLTLQNINMFMDGSYSSCSNARIGVHGGSGALISSTTTSPNVLILGGGFNYQISLENFRIQSSSGIGLRTISSSANISLKNIVFSQLANGAISVEGNANPRTNLLIENSTFLLNSSINGGAIKCSGTNNLISLENTVVSTNSSTGDGGAIHLDQACDFSMTGSGLTNNFTNGRGGAIYAEFGSDIILEKVQLTSNTAISDGGAIYAVDSATTIDGAQLHFINNSSDGSGGAISLNGGASFTLKQTSIDCIDTDRCNFFDGNESVFAGGAIVNQDSHIDISSTYFEDNRSNFGTAIYSSGLSSSTRIEGCNFNHNGDNGSGNITDNYVVRATTSAFVNVLYSTFANNNAEIATFGVNNGANFNLQSSIIYDASSGNVHDGNHLSFNFQCLIAHEVNSLPDFIGFATLSNPQFINPGLRNYHLKINSSAIDLCSQASAVPMFRDIDFRLRGLDDPARIDILGTYDVGADEYYPKLLFANSFE